MRFNAFFVDVSQPCFVAAGGSASLAAGSACECRLDCLVAACVGSWGGAWGDVVASVIDDGGRDGCFSGWHCIASILVTTQEILVRVGHC